MPRISGQQVKLAVCLTKDGDVLPADEGRSFTHMLKVPPPYGDYEAMGAMEWYSMQVAKACRLKTEDFAAAIPVQVARHCVPPSSDAMFSSRAARVGLPLRV